MIVVVVGGVFGCLYRVLCIIRIFQCDCDIYREMYVYWVCVLWFVL